MRNLIGKIECYYRNEGYGSYVNFNNYPYRVKVFIEDEKMRSRLFKDTPFTVYDEDCLEIYNYSGGILTWLKKWMKENNVYFGRTDFKEYSLTSCTCLNEEYEYK